MAPEDKKRLYAALAAPFPEDTIERTDGRVTGKGYSTTGIKHQFIINRLNEVLGLGGYHVERTITVKETQTSKGRAAFEAVCEANLALGSWVDGKFAPYAVAWGDGGHTAMSMADARKGAYTNAVKKAAAFFGVGRQAYEGTLDDDNVPSANDAADHRPVARRAEQRSAPREPAPPAGAPPGTRRRLTERQHRAIMAIAREQGMGPTALRNHVKSVYGVQPEFLTSEQASELIADLQNGRGGNGADGDQWPAGAKEGA